MTHIANYPTKKAFREAVSANPNAVWVDDPSIFPGACSGTVAEVAQTKQQFTVTNHPKRSWFAAVSFVGGRIKVE